MLGAPSPLDTDRLLAEVLQGAGQVSPADLRDCLQASSAGSCLGEVLLARRLVDPSTLEHAYRLLPSSDFGPLHPHEVVGGRYRVEGLLGRGGMGAVYRVRELGSPRELALKVILPGSSDELDLLRFQRESEVAARLGEGGGFVAVRSGGEHRGLPYFAMDLVEGPNLESAIKSGLSHVDLATALALVARALQTCHEAGLVHRDLKPANLLLGTTGPKIADLGLVRDRDAKTLTQSGELLGTPAYMAPEQVQDARSVDPRTDVYALGAILYHGLAGQPPFAGTCLQVLSKVVSENPPPPSQVTRSAPGPFELICLQAMAKDPAQRYPSASAFAEDLERALRGDATLARARRPKGLAALAAVALLLAGGGLWAASRSPEPVQRAGASSPARDLRPAASVALQTGFDELFQPERRRTLSAITEQARRIVAKAARAGLSPQEIQRLKRERWELAKPTWELHLETLAKSKGEEPSEAFTRLRTALASAPPVPRGHKEITARAFQALLAQPSDVGRARALRLQVERIPLGLEAPRELQRAVYAAYEESAETFLDCLRVGVPIQFELAHFRVRQLGKYHGLAPPSGQAGAFVRASLLCPKDWPRDDNSGARRTLAEVIQSTTQALEETPLDLGQRYVIELRYLKLKAQGLLARLDLLADASTTPSPRERALAIVAACRAHLPRAPGVLAYEFSRLEGDLMQVLGERAEAVEVWERAISRLQEEVAAPPYMDFPELYLGHSWRELAHAQLRAGDPEASLLNVARSLKWFPRIRSGFERVGGVAVIEGQYRRKATSIAIRAHLATQDFRAGEKLVLEYLNRRSFEDDLLLAESAVALALLGDEREEALRRFALLEAATDDAKRLEPLRRRIAERWPDQD